MDDLVNHRKRKATHKDDVQDLNDNAPRQPWLDTDDSLCTKVAVLTPTTTKRPRIDTLDDTLRIHGKRYARRSPIKMSPPRLATTIRHGSDLEDIGVVSNADPGPSSGSLLRDRASPSDHYPPSPTSIIDFNASHIPAMQPLINRQTLKELELDAIFRNPQLRHDLLFDSNLQFRPRRKRDLTEKYWNALWAELQTGCTCISFDHHKKPHPVVCICTDFLKTPVNPIVYTHPEPSTALYTIRMPSRIPALLSEFLEVLLLVIQPLSTISGVYVNASTIKEQMEEHAAQAAYIRTIFEPALIEQELSHKIFDPSGLFSNIGDTLKRHCAPMRDRAVEEMVQLAQQPGPEAFKAVRSCLELLELMKLDIANHQLNQLRPLLTRTSSQFELKTFKNRFGAEYSLHKTREWLHNAHEALLTRKRTFPHGTDEVQFSQLPKDAQIYTAVLKGIVDMVFDASIVSQPPSPTGSSPPSSPISPSSSSPLAIPETLYLDKSRLSSISSDASDTTALYMFMLLFRQLVLVESGDGSGAEPPPVKVDEQDMLALKREIRDIGPSHLGACFLTVAPRNEEGEATSLSSQETKELENRQSAKQDIILQVAKRAHDVQTHRCHLKDVIGTSSDKPANSATKNPFSAPDPAVLGVAERWADSHMYRGAPLTALLHNRMRDVVFDAVLALALPYARHDNKIDFLGAMSTQQQQACFADTALSLPSAGMEGMSDEIRKLAEKITRLALVHLNAYLGMYESEGFLKMRDRTLKL